MLSSIERDGGAIKAFRYGLESECAGWHRLMGGWRAPWGALEPSVDPAVAAMSIGYPAH